MLRLCKYFFFFLFLFSSSNYFSQKINADSLFDLLKKPASDSITFKILIYLGDHFQSKDPDSAFYFHYKAKKIAVDLKDDLRFAGVLNELAWDHYLTGNYDQSIDLSLEAIKISEKRKVLNEMRAKKVISVAMSNLGTIYNVTGEYHKALDYFNRAVKMNREIDNKAGEASNLSNLGIIYKNLGNYPEALRHHFAALKINEETGKKGVSATNYGNIGVVLLYEEDFDKALEYFNKAIVLYKETNNILGQALNFGNLGLTYDNKADYTKALEYYARALELHKKLGNMPAAGLTHANIGIVFFKQNNFKKALEHYTIAQKIYAEFHNKPNEVINLGNIGLLYLEIKKYGEAETYLQQALKLSMELNSLDDIKQSHENFSQLYEKSNRPALALKHYKLFMQYKDSISNEENTRKSIQLEYKFNYEKKFTADSVVNVKEKQIKEAEIQKQHAEIKVKRNQQYALIGGLLLLILFSAFIFNRFKITKKQKRIIEEQKHAVDEKQKEILDSIRYAKRIQSSLLPTEKYIARYLTGK